MSNNINPSNPTNTNDPDELRREIARTRGNLSQNVNALGEAVDPSNVARRQAEKVQDRVKGAGRGIKERIMGSDDDYDTRGDDARYGYASTEDERGAGEKISDAASEAGDRLRGAADSARYNLERAPKVARRRAQGNPLAAGLIALGAGWLVGSLIPVSERERELAVKAKETAQDKSGDLVEGAKSLAQDSADNLKKPLMAAAGEALKSGLTSSDDSSKDSRDNGQNTPKNN